MSVNRQTFRWRLSASLSMAIFGFLWILAERVMPTPRGDSAVWQQQHPTHAPTFLRLTFCEKVNPIRGEGCLLLLLLLSTWFAHSNDQTDKWKWSIGCMTFIWLMWGGRLFWPIIATKVPLTCNRPVECCCQMRIHTHTHTTGEMNNLLLCYIYLVAVPSGHMCAQICRRVNDENHG